MGCDEQESTTGLPDDAAERFARHLVLPEIGGDGQRKLAARSVLIVGVGGLGSPVAMYLAAAGIGSLGLVDCDTVELSNLQRQIIHSTAGLGRLKTASGAERLAELNPAVAIQTYPELFDRNNADRLVAGYDAVVGCVDNIQTRYVINQACVRQRKPNIYGTASMFHGQASVFPAGGRPCYRCFFREPPPPDYQPSAEERGVFSPLVGVVGSIQAAETIKLLLGIGEALIGTLLLYDALAGAFRRIALRPDPDCPVCGEAAG